MLGPGARDSKTLRSVSLSQSVFLSLYWLAHNLCPSSNHFSSRFLETLSVRWLNCLSWYHFSLFCQPMTYPWWVTVMRLMALCLTSHVISTGSKQNRQICTCCGALPDQCCESGQWVTDSDSADWITRAVCYRGPGPRLSLSCQDTLSCMELRGWMSPDTSPLCPVAPQQRPPLNSPSHCSLMFPTHPCATRACYCSGSDVKWRSKPERCCLCCQSQNINILKIPISNVDLKETADMNNVLSV